MTGLDLKEALQEMPVIAIIRGVLPGEAVAVGKAIAAAGVRVIEVPLNSPSPLESIRLLADEFTDDVLIGAGTVLTAQEVDAVCEAGGKLVVSPNVEPGLIHRTLKRGMTPLPGFMTTTELFTGIHAGARNLKLFPASPLGISALKAISAVKPPDVSIFPVGGVGAGNAQDWMEAGAAGLGIGSEIFTPGDSPETVYANTVEVMEALNANKRSSSSVKSVGVKRGAANT